MSQKPSIPKGTRDFSPIQMARRNYIFDTITKVYKKYGFQQIETPAMENLSTLLGTGGEESDKLIFKILNSGDYLKKVDKKNLITQNSSLITKSIAEKALRYDLTVPFARYVVQNQNDITFPFRRFQIQPVWRADRPQKGRYREFYQCDADIIGSDSLLNEVDLIKIIDDVFTELFSDENGNQQLDYTVSINNRKILQGIIESVGETDKFESIVVAIDKFDKIGEDGVIAELIKLNIDERNSEKLMGLCYSKVANEFVEAINSEHKMIIPSKQLEMLSTNIKDTLNGQKGIKELEFVFEKLKSLGIKTANIKFDPTLARGLGYYTGTIIEVKVDGFPSITGGGRYDDLTAKFEEKKKLSGVGISFGADRIYDVLLDNDLYPNDIKASSTQVLFTNQGLKDEERFLPILFKLRKEGINSEIYPEDAKWKKQMTYVGKKNIEFMVSSNQDGGMFVKRADKNEKQQFYNTEELIGIIKNN